MPSKPIRNRLVPYKLLTYLLYSEHTSVLSRLDNLVRVDTGSLCRELRISNSRLSEAFEWLVLVGLLQSVNRTSKGCITAEIKPVEDRDDR